MIFNTNLMKGHYQKLGGDHLFFAIPHSLAVRIEWIKSGLGKEWILAGYCTAQS
jgi:hypothetical protein